MATLRAATIPYVATAGLLLACARPAPTNRAGAVDARAATSSFQATCLEPWNVRPLWTNAGGPRFEYPLDVPSSIPFGSTYLLAANTRRPSDDRPMGGWGGRMALVTLDGRVFDLPEDARNGVSPLVGVIGDTIYLLWGEMHPETPSPSGYLTWPPSVAAVWFATRTADDAWTRAREIIRARDVDWGYAHVSLLPAPDGALELLFSAGLPREDKLLLARFARGGASLRERPLSTGAFHTQMARRGDTAFVLLVGADTLGTLVRSGFATDQNSLFLTTWHSSTQTWGPLRLVQLGKEQGAVYPRLVLTPDGAIHAMWTQLGANVLRHVSSRDGGVTWSAATDLMLPGAYATAAFAVGDNAVALLYDDIDFRGPPAARLGLACWSGSWLPARRIGGEERVSSPSLLDPNRLAVFATRQIPENPTRFENVIVSPGSH